MDQNGKAAQKREKQEWAIAKPKLDNARQLRDIYFIDSEDGEHKETIKNARRKLEVPMDAAMPCKKGTKTQCPPQETERRGCESNHKRDSRKQSTYVSWRRTGLRDNALNHLCQKVTSLVKGKL